MKDFAELCFQGRREWLGILLRAVKATALTSGYPSHIPLCTKCFRRYHGIKRTFFDQMLKKVEQGQRSFGHANTSQQRRSLARRTCTSFVHKYSTTYGDHMPDAWEIHLPYFNKTQFYMKYCFDLRPSGMKLIKQPCFNELLKDDFPNVKMRQSKKFTKCTDCSQVDKCISESHSGPRAYWVGVKEKHNAWQMRERQKYTDHVTKANNHLFDTKCLTITIDGMDNKKCSLPRMTRPDKNVDSCEQLQTHLTGVLIDGLPNANGDKATQHWAYTWYAQFPTGSDVLCTILADILCRLMAAYILPPTLYLHLDNCWRENKNRYILAFLHLLVRMGYWRKIKLCFKPVGHTHCRGDQVFSAFSRALGFADVTCLSDLHKICEEAYAPRTVFYHLDNLGSWTTLLKPFLPSVVSGQSRVRCFLIKHGVDGVVRHHYRLQLQTQKRNCWVAPRDVVPDYVDGVKTMSHQLDVKNDCWMPNDHKGLELLAKGLPDINKLVICPYKKIDTDALERTFGYLLVYLTDDSKAWWRKTIDLLRDQFSGYLFNSCFYSL